MWLWVVVTFCRPSSSPQLNVMQPTILLPQTTLIHFRMVCDRGAIYNLFVSLHGSQSALTATLLILLY